MHSKGTIRTRFVIVVKMAVPFLIGHIRILGIRLELA